MSKIDTKEWKEFRIIDDLNFQCYHGTRLNQSERVDGDIVFLTAGKENQGVSCLIGNNCKTYMNPITVDMFGNCFYHDGDVSGDDNIYFFTNNNVHRNSKLFITAAINSKIGKDFSYAYQFRQSNANTLSILLPITSTGEPDWDYMEQYMKEIMEKEEEYAEKLAELSEEAKNEGHFLDVSGWGKFRIGDFFINEKINNKLSKHDLDIYGTVPVYSSETENNGILGYTNKMPNFYITENNPLFIIFGDHTRAVSIATENFCVADNVKVLSLKNPIKQLSLQFILTSWKYNIKSLGYSRHWSIAKETIIHLPITSTGEPDWDYMENFMDQQMKKAENIAKHLDQVWCDC